MEKNLSIEIPRRQNHTGDIGRLAAAACVESKAVFVVEDRINLYGVEERLTIFLHTGSISREVLNGGKSVFDTQAEPDN